MKVNQFPKVISENWPIKVLCFCMAILLYLFYHLSLVDRQSIVVPLELVQDGGVEAVGDVPKSVKIIVRSSRETRNASQINGIKASLNLNYLPASGIYEVPVSLSVSDTLMGIDPLEIIVKPETVMVNVERKLSKAVKVDVPFFGTPAHGYEIKDYSVTPKFIQIVGADSIVKGISSVLTNAVDVTDVSEDCEFTVDLQRHNKMIDFPNNTKYSVKVSVAPAIVEKEFTEVSPLLINGNEEFIFETETKTVSYKISGPELYMENYEPNANSVSIDCSSVTAPGSYTLPVAYSFPSVFKIVSIPVQEITFTVNEKPVLPSEETEGNVENSTEVSSSEKE